MRLRGVRSFAESRLTVGADAPVAVTQCAARSGGFSWLEPGAASQGRCCHSEFQTPPTIILYGKLPMIIIMRGG
jgi:hypothetical protein